MTHPLNVVDLDLASEWHTRSHAAAWPSPSDYAGGSSEDLAVTNGKTNYTDFDGDTIRMKIWMGEHIAILTPAGISPDGSVMHNLVKAFDGGFSYYESITGRDPTPYDPTTINGRDTIAIVPDTLGNAASTYVGFNGSEIAAAYFGGPFGTPVQSFPTYNAMSEHGTVNSLMFYEFGRSFWFYGDQLGDYGFVTGFAYINREFAIMKAGFPIDPSDIGGGTNRDLPAIAQTFFRDETATGLTTLGQSLGIDNPTGSNDAASLAGSLYQIFREHAGALAWSAFWHLMPSEPEQHSATDAFANFAADAMAVTGQDYSFLFKPDTWTYAAGTSGDEIMTGTITGHTKLAMLGFGGNDRLLGTSGSDFLLGDTGDDLLRSGGGADDLAGGSGNDTLQGGAGADNLSGGAGKDTLSGGTGADAIAGGTSADIITCGAHDSLAYDAALDSTSLQFDRVRGFDTRSDTFNLPFLVTGIDPLLHGSLSASGFDATLRNALSSGHLQAHHAALFDANGGEFAGDTFLIVDFNGKAGYQAGRDLVIQLDAAHHLDHLTIGSFI